MVEPVPTAGLFSETAWRTNRESWEQRAEECEQTAWSSGCSSHIDFEKAVWWLLWSTTLRANTQDRHHTGVCIWRVCVCVSVEEHTVSGQWLTKCCAVKTTETVSAYAALTLESGDDKQLLFTFSPRYTEMRKGRVLPHRMYGISARRGGVYG